MLLNAQIHASIAQQYRNIIQPVACDGVGTEVYMGIIEELELKVSTHRMLSAIRNMSDYSFDDCYSLVGDL